MTRWLSAALVVSLVLPAGLTRAPSALAQDDWSLTREPRRPERQPRVRPKPRPQAPARAEGELPQADLSERYVKALLARPDDKFALERLRELALARDGSLGPTIERFKAEAALMPAATRPREALARVLSLAGQDERAIDELDFALAQKLPATDRERVLLLRAELLREVGRREEAQAVYRELSQGGSKEARARGLRGLGELALEAGQLAEAEQHYRELERANPGHTSSEWPRALSASGRHREAAAAYRALAEKVSDDRRAMTPFLREAAREALAAGDHDEAVSALDRAISNARDGERAELYDLLIEAHRKASRLHELSERLGEDAKKRPELLLRAAMLWDELGRDQQAITGYRAVLARSPRDIDTRARLARLLARGGYIEELTKEYRELVRLAPDEPSFVIALAELLRERGEREEAMRVLGQASQRAPRSLSLHRALADVYARWGAREQAERELSILARLDPNDASHIIALGDEAFERGDKMGALRTWQRLLEGPRDRAEAHATLAGVLGDHGLFEQALEHAAKAVELAPTRSDFRRSQASLLERAGRYSEAESVWSYVLEHAPDDPAVRREARQHLVNIWLRGGMTGRRAAELEMRFRGQPPDLEAGRTLAELYAHDPSKSEVEIALLEDIVKKAPNDVESLRALERAYTRRGALDKAQATLDRLVARDPASASVYLARAVELSLARYRDDEALRYAERAVQIRPKDGKAQRLLGDLFRRKHDLARAITAYERAAQLDTHDHDTRILLAQLETARGRDEAAQAWLTQVIKASPDDELVARAARSAMQLALPDAAHDALELTLLELCLARPERPLYRRLLVESYARRLGHLAERVRRGVATNEEQARLERVGTSSIKPLLEALADSDAMQRTTALDLLGAARVRHAGGALMTLAEQSDNTAERSRALSAVGLIADRSLAPRLRALIARNERRLLPMALWALAHSEGARANDVLMARLRDDRDVSIRVMCALALGAFQVREALPLVKILARDRNVSLRAAALWALSRIDRENHRSLFVEALSGPPPASLVALSALPHDYDVLVRALSSPEREHRALGVRMLAGSNGGSLPLPVPPLPFVARAYVGSLLEAGQGTFDSARLVQRWADLSAAYERSLRADVPERLGTVVGLSPHAGGLAPTALLEAGLCPTAREARQLAAVVRDALAALATDPKFAEADTALALLAASGGADHRAVGEALLSGEGERRLRVLDALAFAGTLPPGLRKQLTLLFDDAPDWPTRLRIVRLLGAGVGKERLAREPIALVRAAAALPNASAAPACSDGTFN